MTAREKLAGMFPSRSLGEAVADEVLAEHRAEVAEEFAAALLAVNPVEWALAGQHAGADAARLIRRVAAAPTSGHSCGNCDGVDPESCLMNLQRTTPTSKEQRDGA